MNIADIQTALAARGFDPGPIDNILGPLTRKAIIAFQAANGLLADGIVGPQTRAALFGAAAMPSADTAIPTEMPWLHTAHALLGQTESPGAANNPVIMDWANVLTIKYAGDHVAWCGLFMAWCMAQSVPDQPIPAEPLLARNWLKYEREVAPQFGSILVFWRVKKSSWQGHVAFYWGEDATHYHVLGGNQSNAVNVLRYRKDRLLGARYPAGITAPGIRRMASEQGTVTAIDTI